MGAEHEIGIDYVLPHTMDGPGTSAAEDNAAAALGALLIATLAGAGPHQVTVWREGLSVVAGLPQVMRLRCLLSPVLPSTPEPTG